MSRLLVLFLLVAGFSGCATTISSQVALPEEMQGNVRVDAVSVSSIAGVQADVASRLKAAIESEAFKPEAGGIALSINATINGFDVVSAAARFFAGAIAGSSRMDVHVVVEDESGAVVAEYDVNRTANPGGWGAFSDQEQALISETAKGVVEGLFGSD